jgi:2-dehydropantoate 2-reductase
MRVGIIGAGAVGGALAAVLARGGHDVEVTARRAQLKAIQENGIRLDGEWGAYDAAVGASRLLTRKPDLVIVTTKAHDAAAALTANAAFVDGAPVLIVQNGLAGLDTARAAVPGSPVIGGLAMFAASFLKPGRVTVTGPGVTYLGGQPGPALDLAVSLLSPVLKIETVQNFAGAQWSKLVVNQINALPAITGLSAQEVIADRGLRRLMTASIRENIRIGIANGITFEDLHGLTDRRLRTVARLPLALGETLPRQFARRMGTVPNPGSTQQSIRRGQPSEIDYLNGAVVTAAKAVGLEAPINAALVELVHEVELSYVFISPPEVLRRVALLTGETA